MGPSTRIFTLLVVFSKVPTELVKISVKDPCFWHSLLIYIMQNARVCFTRGFHVKIKTALSFTLYFHVSTLHNHTCCPYVINCFQVIFFNRCCMTYYHRNWETSIKVRDMWLHPTDTVWRNYLSLPLIPDSRTVLFKTVGDSLILTKPWLPFSNGFPSQFKFDGNFVSLSPRF